MGLFSKKEKVPSIPTAPQLPRLPSPPSAEELRKKDLPELPSFPQISQQNMNNQTPEDNEVVVDMPPSMQSQGGIHNIESAIPSPPSSLPPKPEEEQRRTLELSPQMPPAEKITKKVEPIFVRIDKFQDAQKDFKQIKEKVKEIESVLKKVKTIKEKEEAEINSWTEDLEKLKARLAEIDANIFNQL